MLRTSQEIEVRDASQIGDARRRVQRLALQQGLSERHTSDAAIVVTEMGTNLLKHAGGGSIVLRQDDGAVELLAVDRGVGMDLPYCLRDGQSSRGTAGNGLGAIKRLSADFDAFSNARGSVLWSRIGAASTSDAFGVGVVCLPVAGEEMCGDDWTVGLHGDHAYAMVVDGLGHGPQAAEASLAAIRGAKHENPGQAILAAHQRMAGSRGGAAAYARVDRAERVLDYASVGNISMYLVGAEKSRGLPAQNGTLAAHFPARVHETRLPLDASRLLVMHSDGLTARWNLADYPGLATRHPAVVAGILWRDYTRGRDDATVLVLRY